MRPDGGWLALDFVQVDDQKHKTGACTSLETGEGSAGWQQLGLFNDSRSRIAGTTLRDPKRRGGSCRSTADFGLFGFFLHDAPRLQRNGTQGCVDNPLFGRHEDRHGIERGGSAKQLEVNTHALYPDMKPDRLHGAPQTMELHAHGGRFKPDLSGDGGSGHGST